MNNMKTTKRALGTSIVALIMCFAMLAGTTYAWFTDTVTSSGNVIKSGKLEVALTWTKDLAIDEAAWNNVEADNAAPIFGGDIFWEPGYTAVRYLKVKNLGDLALQYKLQVVTNGAIENANGIRLSDAIDVYYAPSKVQVNGRDVSGLRHLGNLTQFLTGAAVADTLENKGDADYATLVLKMNENAGNEYQNLSVGTSFDIVLFATQLAYEKDSIDENYDVNSKYPVFGVGSGNVTDADAYGLITIKIENEPNQGIPGANLYAGTAVLNQSSVEDAEKDVVITIKEIGDDVRISTDDTESAKTFDITAENVKAGKEVQVYLYVGTDLNVTKLYHEDVEISFTYDSNTGNIRFKTTSFSPFTVVTSSEPAPEGVPGVPTATITDITDNAPAGAYQWIGGGNNPNDMILTLTPAQLPELDILYEFKADQTPEEAAASEYAEWYCDYYVMVDKDIAANSIALGGYYENFDAWLAFTNLQPVEGNQWIALLELADGAWTYQDIVSGVGTFLCGVADYDGSLGDNQVTFTVQLRLTNPDDVDDYRVCAEISYAFPKVVSSLEEFQAAIDAGYTNIKLGGDINLGN